MTHDPRFSTILKADAALCLACGLPGLLAPGWLAGFLLPQQPTVLGFAATPVMLALGILLAAYAGLLLFAATRRSIPRAVLMVTALADAGWVLGTVTLLLAFAGHVSLWGSIALIVIAIDTGLMGLWKLQALRRSALAVA